MEKTADTANEEQQPAIVPVESEKAILGMALQFCMFNLSNPGFSKILLVPDPTNLEKLLPVHCLPEGICVLSQAAFDDLCEEFLCEECVAKLGRFSIIHTGINLETGEFDPDVFVGLEGGHFAEDEDPDPSNDPPEFSTSVSYDDLSKKRTLN